MGSVSDVAPGRTEKQTVRKILRVKTAEDGKWISYYLASCGYIASIY